MTMQTPATELEEFDQGCRESSSWQVFGLGKVGDQRVGNTEMDLDRTVSGDGLVRADGVVLDPVGLGVLDKGQDIVDLFEEPTLVCQRPEPTYA
jgi:hypothetical protein